MIINGGVLVVVVVVVVGDVEGGSTFGVEFEFEFEVLQMTVAAVDF
jgi:hypothetical protein